MRRNYIREFRRWVHRNGIESMRMAYTELGVEPLKVLAELDSGQKFLLPDGGDIIDNSAVKVLDDIDLIRLPFPVVVLEYDCSDLPMDKNPGWEISEANKRIVIVSEAGEKLRLRGIWQFQCTGQWITTPSMLIARDDLRKSAEDWSLSSTEGREFHVDMAFDFEPPHSGTPEFKKQVEQIEWDLMGEWNVTMRFMAALACSNVHTRSIPVPKLHQRKRGVLAYDSYHELVLGGLSSTGKSTGEQGDRRGPREHLRRGHIRRLQDGRRVWVNASVVNAGVGGRVVKRYNVK